jgi:GTP cyclohydrolase II
MTNNPHKYDAIAAHGLAIVERVPLVTSVTGDNESYLRAKQQRLGHALGLPDAEALA